GRPSGETHLLLEIPRAFQELKAKDKDLARRWRLAARDAFERAFAEGYAAVEFLRAADGRGAYLLVPQPRRGMPADVLADEAGVEGGVAGDVLAGEAGVEGGVAGGSPPARK